MHASMFSSSCAVTAMSRSLSSTFASRWTDIAAPLPQRVMTSSVSDRSFTFSFSISTTVISWFSLASSSASE